MDAYQDHWHTKWEDFLMKEDELIVEYVIRFNKILKRVNYNNNFTQKIKVRKFVNDLTDRLAKLAQVQNLTILNAAIAAATSAEMGIK